MVKEAKTAMPARPPWQDSRDTVAIAVDVFNAAKTAMDALDAFGKFRL